MSPNILVWVAFNIFVLVMLALDLGVFHRRQHVVGVREALLWSALWIALALVFNAGLYIYEGQEVALMFFTGYLLEKSLSVDNLFVFLLIFSYFSVPRLYQHKVLFWGILGALVMRATMIAVGVTLIHHFHWILYVFGAFLIFTGVRMAMQGDEQIQPDRNPVVRLFTRFFPVTTTYHESKFFVRLDGRLIATPLFIVVLVVEATDVVFAVDSIPAIFAVTTDPFIVYTSNIFAILGLRALYFALAGVMGLLPLPQVRAVLRARLHRHQDGHRRLLQDSRSMGPCRGRLPPAPLRPRLPHLARCFRGPGRERGGRGDGLEGG